MTNTKPTILFADIYMRLSSEEAGCGESSSITNQRQVIHKYCQDNDICIVKEFVDDGYSGANFNRPGFSAMLGHLASGKVNMVLTKDLSRLGRDMAESSNYAERVFPNMGLRYIAISDNFDSDEINPMAPFQFAMNDVYLRDASRKIRQVLQTKRQNGEYCTAAPFGYMKNPQDKTRLIPDPNTAPIVQRIFKMATDGQTCRRIAITLTDEGVITPSRYKADNSNNYTDRGMAQVVDHWCHTTVKRILQNEVYLGKTQLGKTKKASLKSTQKVYIPKDQWYQFENTHQPLVSIHDFELVQHYLKIHSKSWRDGDEIRRSIFNGIVFCANCGSAMCSAGTTYKGEKMKYWFLYCNAPTRSRDKACPNRARIRYYDLLELVKMELQAFTTLSNDERNYIIEQVCKSDNSLYRAERSIADIEGRMQTLRRALSKVYLDNASGIIDDFTFKTMISQMSLELKDLETELERSKQRTSKNDDLRSGFKKFFALLDEYAPIRELDVEIVHTFIDRIEIGEQIFPKGHKAKTRQSVPMEQTITIYYKFIGNVANIPVK